MPDHLLEIDAATDVLDEIEASYLEDLEKHRSLLADFPPDMFREDFKRYRTREMWRIGSYVVFACTLEGIIRRLYLHVTSVLERVDPTSAQAVELRDAIWLKERDAEIAPFNLLRNKVFAHTSFGDPRKDSHPLQITSLWQFAGASVGMGPNGLSFGGISVNIGGKAPERDFPRMEMASLCLDVAKHFTSWFAQYKEIMDIIVGHPDDHLKRAWPGAIQIGRRS